jgi:uncharacterized protein
MGKKCSPCCLGKILVIVGALQVGLVGAFGFDLLGTLLGSMPLVLRIVQVLIGVAAVLSILCLMKCCKKGSCGTSSCAPPAGGQV